MSVGPDAKAWPPFATGVGVFSFSRSIKPIVSRFPNWDWESGQRFRGNIVVCADAGRWNNVLPNDDQDGFHEECGVFGILGRGNVVDLIYYGLYALQHRGQQGAGICIHNGKKTSNRRAPVSS